MRIEELTLLAPDLEAQAAFYGARLGLPVERCGEELFVSVSGSRLVFRQSADQLPGPYHVAFNVPADVLPVAKAWLRQRGVPPVTGPDGADSFVFEKWDARATYFEDAAGNLLEFIARDEIGGSDGAAFGPHSILCVSEAGVVTDDVPRLCSFLTGRVPLLAPYRQEVDGNFVALGDACGLFVVVRTGRVWYPTADRAAVALPMVARVRPSAPPGTPTITLFFDGAGARAADSDKGELF
jgi:catechol 2,3-dioxygenase-like lactoylglutathione lyase family enzyme